jgi:hypothetical protein
MVKVDKQTLKQILESELNYQDYEADLFLRDFPETIHDPLEKAYNQWLTDRTVSEEPVEGLLITNVMKNRQTHFLMALREINRLFDEGVTDDQRALIKSTLQKAIVTA